MTFNHTTKLLLVTSTVLLTVACGKTVVSKQSSVNSGPNAGIIGGQNVLDSDVLAQSTVALYDFNQGSLCTASIISDKLLVTAAHCVNESTPSSLVVVFGTEVEAMKQTRKVAKFLTTKKYLAYEQKMAALQDDPALQKALTELKALVKADPKIQEVVKRLQDLEMNEPGLAEDDPRVVAALEEIAQLQAANPAIVAKAEELEVLIGKMRDKAELIRDAGDIAIVKFSGGLPAGYKPAKLLRNKADLLNGMDVTLVGYGISNGVSKEGAGTLRKTSLKLTDKDFSPAEVRFDQRGGSGACHGDSGGPAYTTVRGESVVFGVTSRGSEDKADDCSQFAIYTSIPGEVAFVDQAVTELNKSNPDPIPFLGLNRFEIPQSILKILRPN